MKIRWGVIGAGGIADRRTIPGLLLAENAELVAVMEVNKEFAERIKEKYNAKKAYDSVDEILADQEIDAVYIATPVVFHKEQAIKAAKAKKHILIEKPVALSVADTKEVMDACKKENVLLGVGFMMRFHSYHQKIREIIADGKIGDIVSCRAQLTCWYPDMSHAWRQKKELSGGGALMDMGVHCIDILQYLTNAKAVKVAAITNTKTFGYEVDDSASVLLQLDNGANAYVDTNFNIPDDASKSKLELYGTKGSIVASCTLSQEEGGDVELIMATDKGYDAAQSRSVSQVIKPEVTFGNMYTKEIESFSRSILNNSPAEVSAQDALFVQKIVEAAYDSSKNGRFIQI